LQRDDYAAVLDLQEQVKGALIARMARGVRHGPDRASIREPIATLLHDVHHAIDPDQHFIVRCRELAAASLGYRVDGPPRFGLVAPAPTPGSIPERPFVVFFHGTSRAAKLWLDAHWRRLVEASLPPASPSCCRGKRDDERARSELHAAGVTGAIVPPRRDSRCEALRLCSRAPSLSSASIRGSSILRRRSVRPPCRLRGDGPECALRRRPRRRLGARSSAASVPCPRRRTCSGRAGALMRRAPAC
jgi:hypothetical protein